MFKYCTLCASRYRKIELHMTSIKHVRNTMPVSRRRRVRTLHVSMRMGYEDRMWAEQEAREREDGTYNA